MNSKHVRRLAPVVAWLLLHALMLAAGPVRAQQSAAVQLSTQCGAAFDCGKLLDVVIDKIAANYFDPDQLKRETWTERARAARAMIAGAQTVSDAVAEINRLTDTLKVSHLGLLTPDEVRYYLVLDIFGGLGDPTGEFWGSKPYFAGIGMFSAVIDGRHFVDGVLEGSPADRAGLKIGDEIVDVDGAAYHEIRSFRGRVGQEAKVRVRRTAGGTLDIVAVSVVPIVPREAFKAATAASARVIERGGKRIGYFHVWGLADKDGIETAVARLSPGGMLTSLDTAGLLGPGVTVTGRSVSTSATLTAIPLDAMIVDMRGKIGGFNFSHDLLSALDRPGVKRGAPYIYKRRPDGGARLPEPKAPNPSFKSKSVMLIDHHTRSAGELVANSFRHDGFGPLIGTTTAGHVLGMNAHPVPGGFILQIPIGRFEHDGRSLEGVGVPPDRKVERPLPYAQGADPALEDALAYLTRN